MPIFRLLLLFLLSINIYAIAPKTCFTPQDQCTDVIVKEIQKAKKSIDVQAFIFTSEKIEDALIAAHVRGIHIRIILDRVMFTTYTEDAIRFKKQHISIWKDDDVKCAHNKVMIIDGKTLITGSFNFTNNAQYQNAENVLILDNATLADIYEKNFRYRLSKAKAI